MKTSYDILIKPIITEKSSSIIDKNIQYTFAVDVNANKIEIKKAVEEVFNVKVVAVRTINVHRKAKRVQRYEGFKSAYKKAIVRLAPGQTIDAFEI